MKEFHLSRNRIASITKRLLLMCAIMLFVIPISAQSQKRVKVTMQAENMSITEILTQISKQTNVAIFQNANREELQKKVSINVKEEPLDQVLDELLKETNLSYRFDNGLVVIIPSDPTSTEKQADQQDATGNVASGTVYDSMGEPLVGVNVLAKGTYLGTITDAEGHFKLKLLPTTTQLQFSYIGYQDYIVDLDRTKMDKLKKIVLKEDVQALDNVMVVGYFTKTKLSNTGSQISVKGDELRSVGSLNFMQAINAFDPSLRVTPSTEFGSDPNRVPEITIRGENGFDLRSSADDSRTNPNAPLYLIDGIEVGAAKVYDLDMNRIESFVILKDASATSLYGSRGANGVILITTIAPKEGEIKVSFNSTHTFSVPDLSDYNLMNAAEKLEYERLGGVYTSRTGNQEEQIQLDIKYNNRLAELARGVDTYWLSKPLRTSLNQRYNAFIEGGDRSFRYGLTLYYDNDKGVMKGSERERYGINVSFHYRIGTKFLIRNDVTVNNIEAVNSPYGPFYVYAQQNPNERIYDPVTGDLIRSFEFNNLSNPLVNATLPNTDQNTYTDFTDNVNFDWRINKQFRVTGRAALTKRLSRSEIYLSPFSNVFDRETEAAKKGSYTAMNTRDMNFDGNATASYNNVFTNNVSLNLGVGTNVATVHTIGDGYTATGFLSDNMHFPQYALQFKENAQPSGVFDRSRLVGFFANMNVGYDNRYFLDFSYRTDGSSRFGRDSRFAPFWSVGAAWNLDKESWWNGKSTMKIRGSVGATGSVNFSADQAITKYQYAPEYEYNGIYGAQLLGYGNPGLRWQSTLQDNIGMDLALWNNRVVLNVDAYRKTTKNLLLPIDVAPSTGFSSYTENLGSMENKGIDGRLRFNLIQGPRDGLNWNITLGVSHNRNKIKSLSNALEALNEEANSTENVTGPKPLRTYEAGRSQSALMVVQSLGIDPRTGNEIYRKLNGELTFEYDPDDKIIVGDMNPTLQGTMQSNLTWKGLNLFLIFAYEYGAKIYNATLAQKVEGSSPLYNADKRVLYDRWKEPGDVSMFKRIDDTTPPFQTTRLVQDNDYIRLQTLSLSYDLPKAHLENFFLDRAKIILSTTDLFRISTVKMERGTYYPYAKTFSVALNLTF